MEDKPMTRTLSLNWVGALAFICGAAVVVPSLVALALTLWAIAGDVF